jgi:hypothetical protein
MEQAFSFSQLLLNLTGPNWGWQEMQKGHSLKVGARYGVLGAWVEMPNSLIASYLY